MSLQTENMCGYQLRTGWGGFIGYCLCCRKRPRMCFYAAWEEGAGWPGSSVVRRRGTHIYHQTEAQRRGSLLKQTRREYPVWQRTFEYILRKYGASLLGNKQI